MRKRRVLIVWSLVLILSLLIGCAGSPAVEADKTSVVVVMNKTSEPAAGFDPAYGWGAGEHVHEPLIQSTLTVTTETLEIAYDLATEMSVSEDGLTWTVKIRNDVFFTDGMPLTAEDVAFTYNTVKEKSTVNDFTMLSYAEAQDATTVLFHMNTPYAIWPYTMSMVGIVPHHAYDEGYGQQPIGSGRYILKQWDKGQQVILEANEDYYGERAKIKKVTILFMDEDAAFAAAKAGQADIVYTAATYASQSIDGYALLAYESVDNRGINLPAVAFDGEKGNDVTCDKALRQAINLGLDRERIIANVLDGYGTPAYSVCDKMPWFHASAVADDDFDAAVQLLETSGWHLGEDGVRSKNGVRAAINLLYPTGDSVRQALAAEVSNQLATLGIAASVEDVGWDSAYARAQVDAMIWGWGAHTPMELYNLYHTAEDGYALYSPYANEAVDDYMDAALQSNDLASSYALWRMAQWDGEGGIIDDAAWVWLVNIDHLYFARDGLVVAEQKIHPHGHGWTLVNNVDQWYWESFL